MTRYVVGIDNGSQSSKVTIYDDHGRVCAVGRVPLPSNDSPRPGVVEYPDDVLWESIAEACRRALSDFSGDPRGIVGIGLCTIRFCRAILRSDGSLAQPVQSWMDERVGRPYRAEVPDAAYVTTSSGYITHRMTGNFTDTVANYQGVWPLDAAHWAWSSDEQDYRRTGMPRRMLFDLVMPGEQLGTLTPAAAGSTGLPAGVPVIATANDKAVEALGAGLQDPQSLLLSLGTYIAGMSVGDAGRTGATSFWTNFGAEPGKHLYESGGIRRGMWTVSWFRDLLGEGTVREAESRGESVEELLGREAHGVPAGSDGLLTVPDWLAPAEVPSRKGSILGFDGRQGRAHMFRSILEGIAMTMKERTDAMAAELGTTFEHLVVTGGGASSDLLTQILADVFDLECLRLEGGSSAGRGAAICAAVATGLVPTVSDGVERFAVVTDRTEPIPENTEIYRDLETVYRDVRAATDGIYRRTRETLG
ncbi:FGGY-family carbohydrate kinase [Brachybacterium fresconis]|uniref:Sugar (Pentulose or hexulose) kinase n=1 Tax=Brachybacterium fresconis TaxID=173363 RepID=A0ABS4YN74_9MICO|nr:FGGY-family carbohydrate kinase [Brachybacterium fresconis]MBP2410244.1 sugar (pentulose or hexulose) kinase [Brachybacterium fresconis]